MDGLMDLNLVFDGRRANRRRMWFNSQRVKDRTDRGMDDSHYSNLVAVIKEMRMLACRTTR